MGKRRGHASICSLLHLAPLPFPLHPSPPRTAPQRTAPHRTAPQTGALFLLLRYCYYCGAPLQHELASCCCCAAAVFDRRLCCCGACVSACNIGRKKNRSHAKEKREGTDGRTRRWILSVRSGRRRWWWWWFKNGCLELFLPATFRPSVPPHFSSTLLCALIITVPLALWPHCVPLDHSSIRVRD